MSTQLIIAGTTRRRAGGWAYTVVGAAAAAAEAAGGEWGASVSRMELCALVQGLGACGPGPVEIHLMGEGTLRTATEWMPAWKAAGWKREEFPAYDGRVVWRCDYDKSVRHPRDPL